MLIDDMGAPTVAAASVSGKKKEAVLACALEACRLLDMHGELRKAQAQGRERKARDWQTNDFLSSDEDEFLDRTGDIERKRIFRRKLMGIEKPETKTHAELVSCFNVDGSLHSSSGDSIDIKEIRQPAPNLSSFC